MKTVPEISVIIPIYNVEKFLPQALDSLLSQTFSDFEAVCVNDGSSDNCAEILAAYARKDSRLRIISRNNQGVSAARNAALDAARGNYIVFLDPDDLIHARFLEIMLEQIKRTNADFVWCDTIRINGGSDSVNMSISDQQRCLSVSDPLERFVLQKPPYPKAALWDKIFKAELFNHLRFETNVHVAEDFILMFSLLHRTRSAVYINAALKYYRVRKDSLMHAELTEKYVAGHITAYFLLKSRCAELSLSEKAEKILARRLIKMLYRACLYSPYKKARQNEIVFQFWEKYSAVLAQMARNKEFDLSLLDFKKRCLMQLFLRKKFKLLNFFLKIQRLK